MTKTSASLAAVALLGAALAAQPASAADVELDIRLKVDVRDHAPTRRVCNDFTCWTEAGGTPRHRKVEESVERYRRTTTERY